MKMTSIIIYTSVILFIIIIIKRNIKTNNKYIRIERYGNILHVLRMDGNKDAADLLDLIASRAEKLVEHVSRNFPEHNGMQLLRKRFNRNNIYEGSPRDSDFTYTEDKGAKLVICLRNKHMNFHDINLLMFPVIHELGHMCDREYNPGHGGEFTDCFKFLLTEALKIGIYENIDFVNEPQSYCGMVISSNVI